MNTSHLLPSARLATLATLLAAVGCNGGGSSSTSIGANDVGYVVHLQYESTVTSAQKAAFDGAAARIGQLITTKLSAVAFSGQKCKATASDPGYAVNGDVTNLLIFVKVGPIDGVGKILGESGPCFTRTSNGLPVVGIMSFDSADLDNLLSEGLLDTVILHEMLHVVGFGTIWTDKGKLAGGLTTGQDPSTPHTPTFTGAGAVTAYADVGGPASTPVPVEGCSTTGTPAGCGEGTADSHWTETVFQTELMTGWISSVPDPLSKVTIASLADLGYQVDMTKADSYTLPTSGARANALASGAAAIHLGHDTLDVRPIAMPDK